MSKFEYDFGREKQRIGIIKTTRGHTTRSWKKKKKGKKNTWKQEKKPPSVVTAAAIVADRCGSLMHSVAGRVMVWRTQTTAITVLYCEH